MPNIAQVEGSGTPATAVTFPSTASLSELRPLVRNLDELRPGLLVVPKRVNEPTTAVSPPKDGAETVACSIRVPIGMNGAELEVDVQVWRFSCPLPAGIWSETGPEIDIEAVIYSAVGSVNSKKSSNVLPLHGVFVLGNETLSFRIEPRFWTVTR
jgi:hypothetical protein